MIWAPQNSKDPNRDYMGDHYFLVVFGRRRPSKPKNLQITTGDRYFLAFLEWEITIFLFFFGGDDPRNPEICKSQREITIFLLFWSGKSLFSCFFLEATTLETRKSANHNGRSLFSCFFGVGNPHFLVFFGGDDPRNRKSANHSGKSLFSCFFGVGNHYFLVFLKPENLQITTGDHYFLAFLEWEIHIFFLFCRRRPSKPEICKSQREITIFLLFWMLSPPKKSEENVDFPLQKSKKIVISRCDLQISGFEGRRLQKNSKKARK